MENQPTLADRLAPKWGWFPVLRARRRKSAPEWDPTAERSTHLRSGKMDTRNGETRHVLSLPCAEAGDQAACPDGVGCPNLQAPFGEKLTPGVMPRIC
jgi:hypothetical protein